MHRELGDRWGIGNDLMSIAAVDFMQGQYASARSLLEQVMSIARELHGTNGTIRIAMGNIRMGHIAHREGDPDQAWELYTQGLTMSRGLEDRWFVALSLAGLGGVAGTSGHPLKGVRLLGGAEALLDAGPWRAVDVLGLEPVERAEFDRAVAITRNQLDEEAFAQGWAEGRAMSIAEAIEYALHEP